MIWKCLAIFIGSYVLGSLSLSIIVSKGLFGGDIRAKGSGNAGATNMARVFGWGAGLITLGGDALKAVICMVVGNLILGDVGLSLAGAGCILGHCFPVMHDFKGGKGVSVGAALALAIDWRVFVSIVAVFLIVAFLTKKVSAGSVAAALSISVAALVFHVSTPKLLLAIVGMCIVVYQHRGNIQRLLNGTEPDFKAAKDKK